MNNCDVIGHIFIYRYYFLTLYKMVNLSNELSELSHDELQYVIDGYFLWTYKTMKQRGIKAAFIMYDLVGGRRFFGGDSKFSGKI